MKILKNFIRLLQPLFLILVCSSAQSSNSSFLLGNSKWGNDNYKQLKIVPLTSEVSTDEVYEFTFTLQSEKQKLMSIYNLRNTTYNKLAAMALGIFGNETEFGTSLREDIKEGNPGLVVALKFLLGRGSEPVSRGETQIKEIPKKINQYYPDIFPQTLVQPRDSAIATMGYLAETFSMLMARSKSDLKFINSENVFDYIPYVYSGQMHKLVEHTATVVDNEYILHMKQNIAKFRFAEAQ